MLTKSEKAKQGLDLLKAAILEVLRDAQNEGRIHVGVIRERLGLPNVPQDYADNNTLIKGVLYHLRDDGIVDNVPKQGWKIIDQEAISMEKVTLKLSGNIYNQYSKTEAYCSLNGMELTGTPLQIGLIYQTLIGLGDSDVDISADAENIEIYEICNNAIGKETGH